MPLKEFAQEAVETHLVGENLFEILDGDALLLPGVTVTKGYGVVLKCLMVYGDAVGCADGILTTVTLTDRIFFVVSASEVKAETVLDLACFLWETVFLDEGKYGAFYRSQRSGQMQYNTAVTVT